jgi:hypothetical protein
MAANGFQCRFVVSAIVSAHDRGRGFRSGLDDDVSSSFRTWMCTSEAPASNASWVDSTCSAGVIGTAGLSRLRGTEPVIATAITMGFIAALRY